MLEEQEAQQQQWAAQPPQPATPQRRNTRPYEVYQQQHHQQGSLPPAGERDTMTEFQEQFNKIAESAFHLRIRPMMSLKSNGSWKEDIREYFLQGQS